MIWPLPTYQASSPTTSYFHSMPRVLFKDLSVSRKRCTLPQLLHTLTFCSLPCPPPDIQPGTQWSWRCPPRSLFRPVHRPTPDPSCDECWLQGLTATPAVPMGGELFLADRSLLAQEVTTPISQQPKPGAGKGRGTTPPRSCVQSPAPLALRTRPRLA